MLAFRGIQGALLKLVQYSAIKYFTLTTIAVFYNIAPFLTILFASIFLGENVGCMDIFTVIMSFGAVMLITVGMKLNKEKDKAPETDPHEFAKIDHFSTIAFLCLIMAPTLKASQNILLRSMRKMNSDSLSCYTNPTGVIFALVLMKYMGIDCSYIWSISNP